MQLPSAGHRPKSVCGTLAIASLAYVAGSCLAFGTVAAPAFLPGEGDSATQFPVTVTCGTSGAAIHYTLNGSTPSLSDPTVANNGTILINRNLTLKAKAFSGSESSSVTTATYSLTGDIAAGGSHTLSLSFDGKVKAWGEQSGGRLGNGQTATANVHTPTDSKYSSSLNIADAVAIGAGLNNSVFVKSDRTVWAFGGNGNGQLGNNSTTASAYAVQVKTGASAFLLDCVAAFAGNDFSAALSASGNVYTWGSQVGGRLGNGQITGQRLLAGQVKVGGVAGNPSLGGIASFDNGGGFVLAREASAQETTGGLGRVWGWGHNNNGQLGVGTTNNRSYAYPVEVVETVGGVSSQVELKDATWVSAGESHSAIVRWKDGTSALQGSVWTFGQRSLGRLGNGSVASGNITLPVRVEISAGIPLGNIQMVAAGSAHTLALDVNGGVWAWGYNGFGAVGNTPIGGTPADAPYAVKVLNPDGSGQLGIPDSPNDPRRVVWIAAGGDGTNNTSFAIAQDGKVYGWGQNNDGELGNGTTTDAVRPVEVINLKLVPGFPDVSLSYQINQPGDPGNVTLNATPTDPDGVSDISKVEFWLQGSKVGEATSPPWQYVASNLVAGSYQAKAVVTDSTGNTGQSTLVSFSITSTDPNSDLDGDGLLYSKESEIGTNPNSPDTDGDGMGDGFENYYGLAPLSGVDGLATALGPNDNKDESGFLNKDEHDRGLIPTSAADSPQIFGSGASRVAKWWGVQGVIYHLEYSTNPSMSGAVRHGTPFNGSNAEFAVSLSSVVTPVPDPFYVRIATDSGVPAATLAIAYEDGVAPEAVQMGLLIVSPANIANVASVDYYVSTGTLGVNQVVTRVKRQTSPPFGYTVQDLAGGDHEFFVIVTDVQGRRGWSNIRPLTIEGPDPLADDDSDGLPDLWELQQFGNLNQTGSGDADGDGKTNLQEHAAGTNPLLMDTDGDGIPDGTDTNPSPDSTPVTISGALRILTPNRP